MWKVFQVVSSVVSAAVKHVVMQSIKKFKKLTVRKSWMCLRVSCRSLQMLQRDIMTRIYGVEEQGIILFAACLPGNIGSSDASVNFFKAVLSSISPIVYHPFFISGLFKV